MCKEKFSIKFICKRKNAIGIEKIDEQSVIVGVKFIKPRNVPILPSPVKKP